MINNAKTIAKVREYRGAEGIPLDATAWSDGESDIDDDPVASDHTDAATFDLSNTEGGMDAQVITLEGDHFVTLGRPAAYSAATRAAVQLVEQHAR